MRRFAFPAGILASAVAITLVVFLVSGGSAPSGRLPDDLRDLEQRNWILIADGAGCGRNDPAFALPADLPDRLIVVAATARPVAGARRQLDPAPSPLADRLPPVEDADTCMRRVALIDRAGRPLATAVDAVAPLLPEWRRQQALSARPALHATLNATCGVLLLLGLAAIRTGRIRTHLALMVAAVATSAVFLVSYLDYHRHAGSMPFLGEGAARPVYFTILLTHTLLAAVVPPLVVCLLWFAARRRFDRHRALARWTFPAWIYVSVTGVLIWYLLYVAYAPPAIG